MSYNPVTGEGWDWTEAMSAWGHSMDRSGPRWTLRGSPGDWRWSFFNFSYWTGEVKVRHDGFHWSTRSYDTGELLHSGITTSLFEAYNSVESNQPVAHP